MIIPDIDRKIEKSKKVVAIIKSKPPVKQMEYLFKFKKTSLDEFIEKNAIDIGDDMGYSLNYYSRTKDEFYRKFIAWVRMQWYSLDNEAKLEYLHKYLYNDELISYIEEEIEKIYPVFKEEIENIQWISLSKPYSFVIESKIKEYIMNVIENELSETDIESLFKALIIIEEIINVKKA